jgi:hypothetical protein
MAFGSTLVLPQSGGDITLTKINQDGYSSEYYFRDATVSYRCKVRHSSVNRGTKLAPQLYDRHNVEVVKTTFGVGGAPDTFVKAYFVMEQLPADTNVILADALFDWAIATSDANLTALLGWQS